MEMEMNAELFSAAHNMFVEATKRYLDTVKKLTTTYKFELGMENIAVVVGVHIPGPRGLMMDPNQFDKDAVQAQVIWGEKHVCDQLLEHLVEEARA